MRDVTGRTHIRIPSPSRSFTALALTVFVLLALLAYRHTLTVPLLLDDGLSIALNPSIRDLRDVRAVLWPQNTPFTAGRPLLNLSFALNYALGGASVEGYHAFNLLVHALAALALFGLVRRTCRLPRLARAWAAHADALALGCAAVWFSHPLLTASVTYLSQRAESLMGLGYLGALYCFARFTGEPKRRWAVGTVAAVVAAMLVKEVAVTAPVVVFLYDWVFVGPSLREIWRRRGRMHLALAATWLVLVGLMLSSEVSARVIGPDYTALRYLGLEVNAVVHYLRLCAWPCPLVFDYGPDLALPGGAVTGVKGAGLAVILGWSVVALVRRRSPTAFLVATCFILLAPTSSIVPIDAQPMAESRLYLPLVAFTILALTLLFRALGGRAGFVVSAMALAFVVLTYRRNDDFRVPLRLWTDTVLKQPHNSRAEFYLGNAWRATGQLDEAVAHWERSLAIRDNADARENLGNAALARGNPAAALTHFSAALRLKPHDAAALANLANASAELGRRDEAVALYRRALAREPRFLEARLNLAQVLVALGRQAEAAVEFRAALELDPGNRIARRELARLGGSH